MTIEEEYEMEGGELETAAHNVLSCLEEQASDQLAGMIVRQVTKFYGPRGLVYMEGES